MIRRLLRARGWFRNWRRLAVLTGLAILVPVVWGVVIAFSRAHFTAPDVTILLQDRHGAFLGEIGGSDDHGYGYWPVTDLPERVVAATIAIEDRRFWKHSGVDPQAVIRAALQNLSNRQRVSGASTLAMQVARMQHPGARTYANKFVEAVTSILLTVREGRTAVLRQYLTIVPYGNQIHGIAYAARRYLDKPVEDLSWAEVAFLAAIPQSPARMNPFSVDGRRQAIRRGSRILEELFRQDILSPTEFAIARTEIATIQIPPRDVRPEEAMHWVLAVEELFRDPEHRDACGDRFIIRTTLDLELQREASWIAVKAVESWENRGAGNAALMVVDRQDLSILAWVGSTGYFDDDHRGAIDFIRVPRSPGSTLKPFIYAMALDTGEISPSDILDDLGRGAGGIGNADESFYGPLLPRAALATSRNVPASNLLDRVGLENVYGFLGDLGLHDHFYSARHWGLGLAIGGMPVTLERLVRAYTIFLNDGHLESLRWYEGQKRAPGRLLLEPWVARSVVLFLADPMARLPAFPRMGPLEYPFPVAVKTGTSSNYHDAWTVAFSRRYLVAAWVGHPDFRPMNRLSGSRSAARLVHEVLAGLHEDQLDGLEDVGFPLPHESTATALCAMTGRLATPACEQVTIEYLRSGDQPVARCRAHRKLAVDSRNGRLATAATPAEFIETRVFTDLGPRYAAWQVAEGLLHPPHETALASVRQAAGSRADCRITITSPAGALKVLRDPETPAEAATLALNATVDPPSPQLLWYVDGEPWKLVDYPYSTRWPLSPGEHSFRAEVPLGGGRSGLVTVEVF